MGSANSSRGTWRSAVFRTVYRLWPPSLLITLTVALYGPSVGFSFLLDDSYDLTAARRTSYRELLVEPLPGFSYYRPLTFVLYKIVHDLWGGTEPRHYHALSIALHALNTLLLAWLIQRVTGRAVALTAGVLFATFPFAYQAVQIVCSLPHLLVTSAVLGALVLWDLAPQRGWVARRLSRSAAVILALVAPGFHETGTLSGLLLLVFARSRPGVDGWLATRVQRAAIGAVLLGNAAYLAAWFWGFEKPGMRAVTLFDRQQNLAFWVQALAYPVTRSLVLFFAPDWLTQHARSTVLLTGATTVALALTVHALGRQQRLALAACGFALLAFLPALLFLPFRGYVEDGPRLLYPAAPAIATFWGLLPRAGWRWRRGRWGGVTLGTLVVATTLVHSIGFVERRTELARLASRAQEQVVEAARSNPGWPLVVVDAPAWLALHRYEYPLGHFGMNAQPEYLGFDALLEARLGWRQPVESLAVTRSFDYGRYTVGPHGHPSTQASLASYRLSGWVLVPVDLARATAGGTDRVPGMPHGRRSVIGSMGENRSRTGPNT